MGRTRYVVQLLAFGVLAGVSSVWAVLAVLSIGVIPDHGSDFAIYYAAAKALRFSPHANIYLWSTLTQTAHLPGGCVLYPLPPVLYVYPPLLAILMERLTLLPCAPAVEIWHIGNIVLWALSMALLAGQLARWWPGHRMLAGALAVLAAAFYWPLVNGYWVGQVHILILFGILLAFWLLEHDQPMLAGAVLAFVALIKILPAVLLVYYLVRGRWRVVIGATVCAAALCGVMLAVVGVSGLVTSARAILAFQQEMAHARLNEALATVPLVGPALVALALVAFAVGLWLVRKRGDERLGYAWAICTMLLVSPVVWSFYLPWLLPVFMACLGAAGRRDWRAMAALVLLYLTMAFPLMLAVDNVVPLATLALWAIAGVYFIQSAHVPWPASTLAWGRRTLTPRPETT